MSDISLNEVNSNSFDWEIPFDSQIDNDYKIRIINVSNMAMYTESLEYFSLSPKNNVFVGGKIHNGTVSEAHIKRFSSDGNEDTTHWNKTIITGQSSIVSNIVCDSNYNVYCCGYTDNGTDYDYFIKKYSLLGGEDLNWNILYDSGQNDVAKSIQVDSRS